MTKQQLLDKIAYEMVSPSTPEWLEFALRDLGNRVYKAKSKAELRQLNNKFKSLINER